MNNKNRSLFIIQIITGVAFAVGGLSAGYSQALPQPSLPSTAPGEEVVTLPQFSVTGTSVDPYNAAESASAARTASKILDTSVTINVITAALIQDINPSSLFDVSNYFAGVSAGRATGAAGFNDRQTFRGFESFSRTVDNFSEASLPYMYAPFDNFDPAFIDHAELIMGPDSILSPTGTPGGTICAFTKSPQFTQGTDVSAEVGNYNANKVTVDTTGPLGGGQHMAYRIIAAYQDSRTFMPGTNLDSAVGAEFTYKFSDTAKVTFKYFGSQDRADGTAGMSDANGEEVYTPDTVRGETISTTPQPGFQYAGWNGDATWDDIKIYDNKAEAELTAALGEHINMRLAAEVYDSKEDGTRITPAPVLTEKWNQQTGQEISVTPINPTALPELGLILDIVSRQIQVQNDYAGDFKVGGISLQPLVGWAYQQGSIPVWFEIEDKSVPACNLGAEYYSPPVPPPSAFTTNAADNPMNGWTMQGYGFLRAGFLHDRLFVTGGASRTWAGVNIYSLPYTIEDGFNAGKIGPVVDKTFSNTRNPLMPSVQPWHDTYTAGVLGKVLPNVSVYYNYSTNACLASELPEWQAGVQNEFGIKSNFFNGRISVGADHFEISQSNVSYSNPLLSLGESTIPTIYTNLTSHGEELNITGGITKNLSVIASYTYQQLRDPWDRRQRNIPDNMANMLLDYHFNDGALKNVDLFAAVVHEGDVAGETIAGFTSLGVPEQPGYYIPAYTIYNAGAGYKVSRYRFNVNVGNIFNTHAWWQAQSRASLVPYPGTTVTLTVTVHI